MKDRTFAALLAIGLTTIFVVLIGSAVWSAYPGSVGQVGTQNLIQTSPLATNVTGGTMTILSVNGGTAATTSFSISGGTLDKVSALPNLTISAGTMGNVTLSGTSSVQGAVSITGGTLAQLTTPVPGYAIQNSGAFTLASANTTAFYLSSGTTTATSTPCNSVTLSLAGTGMLTSGGTSGMGFATSGTNAWGAPLTLSATNLNTLAVTGTGQASYIYSK